MTAYKMMISDTGKEYTVIYDNFETCRWKIEDIQRNVIHSNEPTYSLNKVEYLAGKFIYEYEERLNEQN